MRRQSQMIYDAVTFATESIRMHHNVISKRCKFDRQRQKDWHPHSIRTGVSRSQARNFARPTTALRALIRMKSNDGKKE